VVTKIEQYRETLRSLSDWRPFLLQASGLPGPRGNLELAQAVADEGSKALFLQFLADDNPERAPGNSPEMFLAFCGVVGLGMVLAQGEREMLPLLRRYANDPRWRIREGVAMALQRWGDVDMAGLLEEMDHWAEGSLLEQRAVVAALCEPRLLREASQTEQVLQLLDRITEALQGAEKRKSDEFKALRKALGYGWSVAVVALPEAGKRYVERWFSSSDPDIQWIMRENLKKDRLKRMDAVWVAEAREQRIEERNGRIGDE
jgi:hypothetical protein